MNLLVFEDAGVEQLFPITTGKPAYAMTCAGYRLIDWLTWMEGHLCGLIRPYLETLQMLDFPGLKSELNAGLESTLLINARLVPAASNMQKLWQFRDRQFGHGQAVFAMQGSAVATALIPTSRLSGKSKNQLLALMNSLAYQEPGNGQRIESELVLLAEPHDLVDWNIKCFDENLQHRISHGGYHLPQPDVHFGDNVRVGPYVVFDTSQGPIVIDDDVKLGAFSFLRGPIYIGPSSRISEYTAIKDQVSIAHTCKIGGEVEASVIEPYTNKQHHGFLGHSYLGSWINLGAGTCNSDLKNTYGQVNVEYGNRKVATGMQFLGCVMGDYAKTAINSSLFTGKMIGTASMVYGVATTNVPSFVNYARSFGELGLLPPEVIVSTQARMFARRNVQQRPCDVQLIHDMYRVTGPERPEGLATDPPNL